MEEISTETLKTKIAAMKEAGFEYESGFRVIDWLKSLENWQFKVKSDTFFIDSEGKSPSGKYQYASNVEEITDINLESLIFKNANDAAEAAKSVSKQNGVTCEVHGNELNATLPPAVD